MQLSDIKKLKVSELRSRLKDLGLDSKGLKAELVGRLWSAAESQEAKEGTGSSPVYPAVEMYSAPATAAVPTPCTADSSTPEYKDTATQTDSEPGPSAALTDAGSGSETGTRSRGKGVDVGVQQEDGGPPGGDTTALETEMGRGRAFYEFKEEIRYKRTKSPQILETLEVQEEDQDTVRIDPFGSHLHFDVGPDGACGQPRFWARFPLLWAGCKLTHGALRGNVSFEVRLERKLLTTQVDEQRDDVFGLRVGWSTENTSLLLGEDELSFAYDGRAKKVSHGKEEDFGEPLSEGDIIGCYASFFTDGAAELSFHKNGRFLGVAFSVSTSVLQGRPLFPHVLCKSCSVRFLLDPTAPPWYPSPPGFTTLTQLPVDHRVHAARCAPSKAQSEVMLMVGLPGSGKTHWARIHMKQHPEKHYMLLGAEELLACMMAGGQTDNGLQQASQCLTDLIKLAAQTPGNYILDQCNVLFSARRFKLQLFSSFRRHVVVVFPSADEWKRRLSEKEQIPETALLKLQVSCTLPDQQDDLLEELQYVELQQQEAQMLLQDFKDEARRLLPSIPKPKKKLRPHKKRPYPHCPLQAQRTGLNGWNETRVNLQSWNHPKYWPAAYQQGYYYNNGYW